MIRTHRQYCPNSNSWAMTQKSTKNRQSGKKEQQIENQPAA